MSIVKTVFGKVDVVQSTFSRRNIELAIMAVAVLPSFLIFTLAAADIGNPLDLSAFTYPIILTGAFLIIHITLRIWAPGADPAILPIAYVLSCIGMAFLMRLAPDVMSYALSVGTAEKDLEFTPESVVKQCVFFAISAAALIAVIIATHRKFKMEQLAQYSFIFMVLAIVCLLSPLLPFIGLEVNGARSWIKIGPISGQPSEFAKIFMILGLASYMSEHRELLSIFTVKKGPFKFPDLPTLTPMLVMWVIAMVLIALEKDFGTALVLFAIFLAMLYVASGKKFYVIAGVLLVAIGVSLLLPFFGHVQTRIDNWLNPFADPQGSGYQMVQSLFSMADGDIFGVGIGLGLGYMIPASFTDCIFSVISEETGLFGASCVLLLYLSLAIRGYLTAARARSDFACLVAVGMTSMIVMQAFIIVAGLTRVIPLTGITLPFISQGGSSVLACFIAMAFIMRCGDEGTGVRTRMTNIFDKMDKKGVLGRYALGKRLTHTLVFLSLLYVVLIGALVSIMFIHAQEYREMPNNNHTMMHEADIKRGSISTIDGTVLAESTKPEDDPTAGYSRVYPAGDLASQVVGYTSQQYGSTGIEDACDNFLAGRSGKSIISTASGIIGNDVDGNNVTLTIDSRIQRAAQDALDGYTGACVVLDAKSGAILAMASAPTYAAGDFARVLEDAANGSGESVMVNRAIQSRYAPGSTFKTITAVAALENGISPDDVFSAPGEMDIAGKPVVNYEHEDLGDVSMADAYAYSSNTAFAQIGTQIGADKLVGKAHDFGFDRDFDFDLEVETSRMAVAEEMGEWELAWAAVGQPVGQSTANGPYATVMEMAMTGAAIANGGSIMKPYIVDGVYSQEGIKTYTALPSEFSRACSGSTASKMKKMMEGVVSYGTGGNAAIEGYTVYGKTGTAETSRDADDSWFVGCVDCGGTSVVVAMVLEEAKEHGDGMNAASHCRGVLESAIEVKQ